MRRAVVERAWLASLSAGAQARLPERAAHYVRDVLRMRAEARLELFDARGEAWIARITRIDPDAVMIEAIGPAAGREERESGAPIEVMLSMIKADRFEWAIQKCTELGASSMKPVEAERSVVRLPAHKREARLARWRRIAAEAARQCGRLSAPRIAPPAPLEQRLDEASDDGELMLAALPNGPRLLAAPRGPVSIWVGPEGGWTEGEAAALLERGAIAWGMGPRILRAETAAIAAVAWLRLSS